MSEIYQIIVNCELLDREELTDEQLADLETATFARDDAYAPYSNFTVGAAIRTNDNVVSTGHNAENVVYLAGHAEGNAIANISRQSRESGLKRVTIVGGPKDDLEYTTPTTSCGFCRQALLELVKPGDDPEIIQAGVKGRVLKMRLLQMLPEAFYPAVVVKD